MTPAFKDEFILIEYSPDRPFAQYHGYGMVASAQIRVEWLFILGNIV